MNEEWINSLRNKIDQHTEPAPEGLWEEIEHELFPEEKKRFVFIKPEITPKKEQHFLFKISSKTVLKAASVILLTLFTKNIITHRVSTPLASKIESSEGMNYTKQAKKENFEVSSALEEKQVVSHKTDDRASSEETEERRDFLTEVNKIEKTINATEPLSSETLQKVVLPELNFPELDLVEDQPEKTRKLTASILTGQITSRSSNQYNGFTTMAAKPMEAQSVVEENTFSAILARNSSETVYTDIKHRSPVTIGFSLLYNLNPKLSLGSGLIYTKLVSELQAGTESDNISSKQTLHYVGLPIHLNYSIFESNRIAAYASAGMTFNKMAAGNTITQYTLSPINEAGPNEKISDKTLHVSANILVGIQYKINSQLGVYLEPGVNYFFKNQSQQSTLFKEKPLHVNTRMGLRFMLN